MKVKKIVLTRSSLINIQRFAGLVIKQLKNYHISVSRISW
jgi:hypothetical protein